MADNPFAASAGASSESGSVSFPAAPTVREIHDAAGNYTGAMDDPVSLECVDGTWVLVAVVDSEPADE